MAIKSQQLRQSFLISGAGAAVLLVVVVAWLTSSRVGHVLEQQADVRGRDVATRVAAIVSQYLKERHHEVASLASMPQLVAGVRQAGRDVIARGLDRLPIPTLEARFDASRALGGEPELRDYLRSYTRISDFSELSVTESHGLNVLLSGESPDFVQRDEVWWQRAMRDGSNEGKWWVLYREPASTAFAAARTTQVTIWVGGLLVAAVAVGALFWLSQRLGRLVTDPVRAAGAIASRVAGGDLSVTVATHRAEATEVAELMSSVHSMVVALRRLVGAIRAAAGEAAALATEVSASTEEMSASTEEMAATSQDLSRRAREQAQP